MFLMLWRLIVFFKFKVVSKINVEEIVPNAWNTCKCVKFKGNTNKTSKFCLQAKKRKLILLEEDGFLKQLTNSISNREDDFVKKSLISRDA